MSEEEEFRTLKGVIEGKGRDGRKIILKNNVQKEKIS